MKKLANVKISKKCNIFYIVFELCVCTNNIIRKTLFCKVFLYHLLNNNNYYYCIKLQSFGYTQPIAASFVYVLKFDASNNVKKRFNPQNISKPKINYYELLDKNK